MNGIKPLVSIIIPVYNRAHIISETILCAIEQSYSNIEIIIVDNDSTDNTWEVLQGLSKGDSRIKIFRNETNVGPVLNWLECLKRVEGGFCKILWSDDRMSLNFIEEALKLFDDSVAFVISPVRIFEHGSNVILRNVEYNGKEDCNSTDFLFNLLIHNKLEFMVSPGCALFRTEDVKDSLVIEIPNTDNLVFKKFGAGNDVLIFLITSVKYQRIKIATNTMSFFRSHKDSISVEKQDDINIYYEWSKSFFIKKYYPTLASSYKSKLFLKKSLNSKLENLYKESIGSVTVQNLLKAGYRKLMYKE